jgi:hypothetical protein
MKTKQAYCLWNSPALLCSTERKMKRETRRNGLCAVLPPAERLYKRQSTVWVDTSWPPLCGALTVKRRTASLSSRVKSMSLYRTLYFMSLVGGMAGLFSWALLAVVSAVVHQQAPWVSNLIASTMLGAFCGGLTVGFTDRWSGNQARPIWIVSGTAVGLLAGCVAGLLQKPVTEKLSEQAYVLSSVIIWMLAGSLIGLGLGLRWVTVNRARSAHAFTGGLFGGGFGGLLLAWMGPHGADLFPALAYMLTGVGICFGITLAPILLREGCLRFVSSGDARAQSKFGRLGKEWEVQPGDSYIIGSKSRELTRTRYQPEIQVFVPDAAIAPRHAVLFGHEGRFYITRHPDIAGEAGRARYVLRVRGNSVSGKQVLHHSDDILIGRTALEFVARAKTHST